MKVSELQPGEGKATQIDGKEAAVYKKDDGSLVVLSNICTHEECQTEWNEDEKSWDCPCHGSRFTAEGDVINGPAVVPLPKLDHKVVNGEIKIK